MNFRGRLKLSFLLPAAVVVIAYFFFGSDGTFEFRRVGGSAVYDRETGHFGRGYYPSLTEGFLHGQLSMKESVDPRLEQLADPWSPDERWKSGAWSLWDTSYYKGRFYMYWTALPSFLLYMPFRAVGGGYPSEGLASTFFALWAFFAAVTFVRRALRDRKNEVPVSVWILLLGFGHFIPFVLVYSRTYEIATLTGTAMTATWACALLAFLQRPSARGAFWAGLWLGLSVAARPNLGVLLLPTALAFFSALRERDGSGGVTAEDEVRSRRPWLKPAVAGLLPFTLIGVMLLWYNFARFDDPFEFGTEYQITVLSMRGQKVCSLCTPKELARFINNTVQYVSAPVGVWSQFPFVVAYRAQLDPASMFPAETEQTAGLAAMIPLTIIGTIAALVLAVWRDRSGAPARAAILVMMGGWLVLFGLSACWFISARYNLDFTLLMLAASVVLIEESLARFAPFVRWPRLLPGAVIALALYSIVLGIAFGFEGKDGRFRRMNPEVYQWIAKPFGTPRE